jgi:uncharacterized protein (DUF169 family)
MSVAASHLNRLARIGMKSSPVAIAFMPAPPPGLERVHRVAAAGCAYWKRASEGESFYTTADDHTNCPIGAFTHGVRLSPEKSEELQSLVGTMIELKYLKQEEVPTLPHRTEPMQIAAYAPLRAATFEADIVVFRGNARQIMLLWEAAHAAGAFTNGAVMGRPACAMLPQALAASSGVTSVACVGNRVYTELQDDELYLTIPGALVGKVLSELDVVVNANVELEKFHRARQETLGR